MPCLFRQMTMVAIVATVSICRADPALEETFEKTYPVEPGTKFSIRNQDGSIRIYGTNTKEMKVQAIKRAYKEERLREISVELLMQPGQVVVDTKAPPKPKWGLSDRSGTVDYVITLPSSCSISSLELTNGEALVDGIRGEDVHARVVNGRLFGHNCFGNLHFSVSNGGVDVGYDWWENRRFSVRADAVNGNVRAFIPGDSAFHLMAATLHGNVANDFEDKSERHEGQIHNIDAAIGREPKVDVLLRATNGSIKIAEANL